MTILLQMLFRLLPFSLSSTRSGILKVRVYQGLSNQNRLEKIEKHQPAEGYLPLGKSFDDTYVAMISDQSGKWLDDCSSTILHS